MRNVCGCSVLQEDNQNPNQNPDLKVFLKTDISSSEDNVTLFYDFPQPATFMIDSFFSGEGLVCRKSDYAPLDFYVWGLQVQHSWAGQPSETVSIDHSRKEPSAVFPLIYVSSQAI